MILRGSNRVRSMLGLGLMALAACMLLILACGPVDGNYTDNDLDTTTTDTTTILSAEQADQMFVSDQTYGSKTWESACTNWSAWYNVGTPTCRYTKICGIEEDCEPWPPPMSPESTQAYKPPCIIIPGPTLFQPQERFRWCFDAAGNKWKETQNRNIVSDCPPDC